MSPDGRIRVLYVSPVGERGGAEAVLLNILKFHDRSRFESVACVLKPGPLVNEIMELGVKTFVVRARRLRRVVDTLRALKALRSLIVRERIDIVFGNMGMGHVYGGLASVGTAARRVWFQHGVPSARDPLDWLSACVPAERIYVNSKTGERAQSRFVRARGRVRLLYPGLDIRRFAPREGRRQTLLCDFGVPAGSPTVAMVARFQRRKGQDVLIRAAALVHRRCPEARFLLIGDTLFDLEREFKDELKALAARLGLADHVLFVGFREDVCPLLDEVDVVAHPTIAPETFGLAVAEALLMRKAVVASNHGGPADIIADGRTGLLVPPGDVDALADSILALLGDEPRRRALGENGRRDVVRRFPMERMIADLEASYLDLVEFTPTLPARS